MDSRRLVHVAAMSTIARLSSHFNAARQKPRLMRRSSLLMTVFPSVVLPGEVLSDFLDGGGEHQILLPTTPLLRRISASPPRARTVIVAGSGTGELEISTLSK